MSADCNCTRPFKLGCFLCSQPGILMPFDAPMSGTYTVVFTSHERAITIEFELEADAPFVVPIGGINESMTHRFYLLGPDGEQVVYENDDVRYDCFTFRTVPAMPGEATQLRMSGVTCENLVDPVNGLTTEQKEGCVLPTIEMDDAPLTEQQQEDLRERLCDEAGPCDPLQWALVGDGPGSPTLQSGSVPSPCGKTLPILVPRGRVTGYNSLGTPLVDAYVWPGQHEIQSIPNASIQLKDPEGNDIGVLFQVPPGTSVERLVPYGYAQLVDSEGNPIGDTYPVVPDLTTQIPAPSCGPFRVLVQDTLMKSVEDPCGGEFNVSVVDEDGADPVISVTEDKVTVRSYRSLCQQIQSETSLAIADCIKENEKVPAVLGELLPGVEPSDVISVVYDQLTTEAQDVILASKCPVSPANVLRQYTASGTWDRPDHEDFSGAWVLLVGGGGSGGAGNVAANVTGGSGGGGGATVLRWLSAADLAAEVYSVIVGAGGASPSTGNGLTGGVSGLYDGAIAVLLARGGGGGTQGSTSAGSVGGAAGGAASTCEPARGPSALSGGRGGSATRNQPNANGSAGTNGMDDTACPGGGGGCGVNSGAAFTGFAGGGVYANGVLIPGAASGIDGLDDQALNIMLGMVLPTIGIGTGGGGGAGAIGGANGGRGGKGGRGAGGGGGGGCVSPGIRGAGGAGGDGFVLIFEVYK